MKARLLFVEDEVDFGNVVRQCLELNNFEVVWVLNATDALALIKAKEHFDLIILDVQLPDFSGFDLAKHIKGYFSELSFLFLSARKEKADKIQGLAIGADDYVTKPFDIVELTLRIRVILRRSGFQMGVEEQEVLNENSFKTTDVEFNADLMQLDVAGQRISLTQREVSLLEYFYQNRNKVLKREEILTALWGENNYFMGRSLDVFISRLRKILNQSKTININNVYGVGFVFRLLV